MDSTSTEGKATVTAVVTRADGTVETYVSTDITITESED